MNLKQTARPVKPAKTNNTKAVKPDLQNTGSIKGVYLHKGKGNSK